ncbi:MAG: hypothetical protein AAF566_02920 [Pseudomonadota bacterium]
MAKPELTFVYIVEPPDYEIMACSLLASIRSNFGPEVEAIGYCPEESFDDLADAVRVAHEIMGAEIRPMATAGRWDTAYPHGNKILAAAEHRNTRYSAFVDSDVLFLRPNSPAALCRAGHVSCSSAASLVWADDAIWNTIWPTFGLEVPAERISLMRHPGKPRVPYFSSGLVVFPEDAPIRFPDMWYETARTLDQIDTLEHRRPYLDQMSLPVAIRRAGLDWNILPEEQHFILGGKLRKRPFPEDRDIFTVHYRHLGILRETGLLARSRAMLKARTGEKYVRRLAPAAATDPCSSPGSLDDLE